MSNSQQSNQAAGRLGQRRVPPSPNSPGKDSGQIRGNYRERLDQLKMEIIQLSNRNMDNTLRNLRDWLKEA